MEGRALAGEVLVPARHLHLEADFVLLGEKALRELGQLPGSASSRVTVYETKSFRQPVGEPLRRHPPLATGRLGRQVGSQEEDALAAFDPVEELRPVLESHDDTEL